jgi:hypothetical protein
MLPYALLHSGSPRIKHAPTNEADMLAYKLSDVDI